MLAGWSSANKFSLLGALRAGSQMISYELIMGLTVLGLILIYGTRRPATRSCGSSRACCSASCPRGASFYQPFAAILFLTAAIAENKRIPFDLPEAESELIAGYLHRVQRDEDGPVHVRRVHRDRDHRRAVHDALPRRLQPALHDRRRLRAARADHVVADAPRRGRRDRSSSSSWSRCCWCAASRSWCAGRCRASATTSCCASPGSSCSRWRSPTSPSPPWSLWALQRERTL